jgi:hypothetical protein
VRCDSRTRRRRVGTPAADGVFLERKVRRVGKAKQACMRSRGGVIAACAVFALAGLGGAATAQTAMPSPSPTAVPTPIAFSASAHADVAVTTSNGTFAGSALFAVAQRPGLTRIDLLSVKSDSFPVPPLHCTIVIDRRANTLTVWNDATKKYRVQSFFPRPAATRAPNATPSPAPVTVSHPSPFGNLEVLDVSLHLTGHTITAGQATTGLAFDLQVRRKGETAASHVAATTQLADDFAAFPMTIDVSLEPGAAPFSAKMSYAVDELTRTVPPPARFRVPAGYTEGTSIMNVVMPGRPPSHRSV